MPTLIEETMIEETMLSGSVYFTGYRRIRDATLTDERLVVSWVTATLVDIPVGAVREVREVRNLLMWYGIRVDYQASRYVVRVFYLGTRRRSQWAAAFASLGVRVLPPAGWLAFDWIDAFRQ